MDNYPLHYVSHNIPFVVLFGLGSPSPSPGPIFGPHVTVESEYPLLVERGIYISSDLPSVAGKAADELLQCFREFDAKDAAWNERPGKGKTGTMGFTYRSVGRAFTLPPHKAKPPVMSPSLPPVSDEPLRKSSLSPVLHSPLSPLSPESPVFPDGIMTSFWFSKHQSLVPSIVISFFSFTLDLNSSTLQDNKLKTEINAIRSSITSSSYKIRFIVVLVCENNGPETNMSERVAIIRRATTLDVKSLFFLSPNQSIVDTRAFIGAVLASVQPSCIEYYRDLSKHARRKRNRGSIPLPTAPPTSGTSRTLSNQGWNVRYETKLGYFAEFRQEMDAAGRNYEAAYELLFDGDVFESISDWSPRFNEARLLGDALAIRILRCLLWTGQTTSAVQSWANHRARIQDLIDRKGKGSGTYGWMAWEARWSAVMAALIEKVGVPIFHVPGQPQTPGNIVLEVPDIYAIPEKAFTPDERLPPWDLLHHEGYWLTRAAKCTRARRKLAFGMPKEDRAEPGLSSASQAASRAHMYDTFLCPEPHIEYALPGRPSFDYAELLIHTLKQSSDHFSKRQQSRAVEKIQLDIAREYMKVGHWNDAMDLLKPIWLKLSWRRAGWWNLVDEMSWAVRACARHLGDGETLLIAEWELMSSSLTQRHDWQYDFSKCLDGLDIEGKPHSIVDLDTTAPTMSITFAFGSVEARVGEPLPAQLVITSYAHRSSSPIILREVTVSFVGCLKIVKFTHDENAKPVASSTNSLMHLYDIPIGETRLSSESSSSRPSSPESIQPLVGASDLTFSPGTIKVFTFNLLPRDAGEVKATLASIDIHEEFFDFTVVTPLHKQVSPNDWWLTCGTIVSKRKLTTDHSWSINVLPKPPKVDIHILNLLKSYYTDEKVELQFTITNNEVEDAEIRFNVQLQGSLNKAPVVRWKSSSTDKGISIMQDDVRDEVVNSLNSQPAGHLIGRMAPGEARTELITFQALPEMVDYILEVTANYHLLSDPDTPISKTITKDLVFIGPFEANYVTTPRVHSSPWPSYFHMGEDDDDQSQSPEKSRLEGLQQKWLLSARVASFAIEALRIEDVALEIVDVRHGAVCRVSQTPNLPKPPAILSPNEILSREFLFEVHKRSLEDRRASSVTFRLCVLWRRESPSSSSSTATSLLVSPITIPFGEPRVVASVSQSIGSEQLPLVHISYTLENPSMHLLTFSVSMEANEDFAFSGPKAITVQLVPLSQHNIRYNLLPAQKGVWIWPSLKVVDMGFGKTLMVGAGEGCRGDSKGIAIWVSSDE